jgi:hypothetical protein
MYHLHYRGWKKEGATNDVINNDSAYLCDSGRSNSTLVLAPFPTICGHVTIITHCLEWNSLVSQFKFICFVYIIGSPMSCTDYFLSCSELKQLAVTVPFPCCSCMLDVSIVAYISALFVSVTWLESVLLRQIAPMISVAGIGLPGSIYRCSGLANLYDLERLQWENLASKRSLLLQTISSGSWQNFMQHGAKCLVMSWPCILFITLQNNLQQIMTQLNDTHKNWTRTYSLLYCIY